MSFATILFMEKGSGAISTFSDNPLLPYLTFSNDVSFFEDENKPCLVVGYKEALRLDSSIDILEYSFPGSELKRWCFSPDESALGFLREFRLQLGRVPDQLLQSVTKTLISPIATLSPITDPANLAIKLKNKTFLACYCRNRVWNIITTTGECILVPVGLYSDSFNVREDRFSKYLSNHCEMVINDDIIEGKVHRFFVRELDWHHDELDIIISRALSFEIPSQLKNYTKLTELHLGGI